MGQVAVPLPRRILVAYTSKPPIAEYLSAAFARRGIDTRVVHADESTLFDRFVIHRVNKLAHNFRIIPKSRNLFEQHPKSHMNFRSSRLRAAIQDFEPDLLFVIRGLGFRPWAYEEAKVKFAWWVEGDDRLSEVLSEVDQFDHYFLIHAAGVEIVEKARHSSVAYLSHAVDPSVFRPLGDIEKDIDFCFVGSWSPKRQALMEKAFRVSANAIIYGPKWFRKTCLNASFRRAVKGRYIGGEALVRLYNRAKIVINATWWGSGAQRGGLNMRLFEVPATGAFLLTDESQDMSSALVPGVHVATFSGLDDFELKLRHYLRHSAERNRIAADGMQHVRTHHSYDNMVESILGAYRELSERRYLEPPRI